MLRISETVFILLCCAYAAVAGFNAVTRTGDLSPDSMVYIDAALNLAQGRGLSHSHRMTHRADHMEAADRLPPVVIWAPLYPMLIAGVHTIGVPGGYAGLGISALFAGIVLLCAWGLSRKIGGAGAGMLGAALLMHLLALRYVGGHAWSETTALACFLAGCLVLIREESDQPSMAALAGLCFGLAFAARYAFFPAAALGFAACWNHRDYRTMAKRYAAYALGFMAAAAPVLARNSAYSGNPLGPARPPSHMGWMENCRHAAHTLFGHYLPLETVSSETQGMLAVVAAALIVSVILFGKRWAALRCAFRQRGFRLLSLWCLLYMVFLIAHRSMYEADPLGVRLLAPATIPLALLAAVLLRSVSGGKETFWCAIGLLLAVAAIGREGVVAARSTPQTMPGRLESSERLQWICANTTEEDLIIGDATMDIPLVCGFRQTLCFMPWDIEARHFQYDDLLCFLRKNRHRYRNVFIIIRAGLPPEPVFEAQWRAYFGDFVTDLVYGRIGACPEISHCETLEDAFVFVVRHGEQFRTVFPIN